MFDRTKNNKKKNKEAVTVNGKEWTKESLKDLLKRNDKAVYRAILLLYSFQTDEEKYFENVTTVNGKGFNKFDAELMSSYARQLKSGRELSERQMFSARPKILKYVGQILNYMREREEQKLTLQN